MTEDSDRPGLDGAADEHDDPAAAIADAFERAAVFDGIDLDGFVGGALEPAEAGGGDAPARRRHRLDRVGRFDRGLWPVVLYKRLKACAALDPSDTDNAARLIRHFGADLRVQIQEGGDKDLWVVWTGTHWDATTGTHAARAVAQQVGEMIKLEAWLLRLDAARMAKIATAREILDSKEPAEMTPPERIAVKAAAKDIEALGDIRAARRDFGITSKNGGRIGHMLTQAAPKLLVEAGAFNHDPHRFATPTQTVWWDREEDPECPDPDTRRFRWTLRVRRGHDRADMITSVLPFDYDPAAHCPQWDAFLARFQPIEADRRFVQVAAGIGLLGVSPQVLVFHYGEGANGKSVFLEVVMRVLAELGSSLPAEAIANDDRGGGLKPSPEIARLFGKRFVRIAEVKEGVSLQEAFVKRITGSEAFPARNLFQGYFEFRPQFIPHMSGNGYPKISGTDNGIWRRMRLVKWPVVLAPSEQRDFEEVVGELMDEGPGILRWLVEGASTFLAEGLVPPQGVLDETATMRATMDTVGEFVASRVVRTDLESDAVAAGALYKAYTEWAEGTMNPVSQTRFGRDLKRFAWIVKDTRSSNRVLYRGLRLREAPGAHAGSDDAWRGDPADDPGWGPGEG